MNYIADRYCMLYFMHKMDWVECRKKKCILAQLRVMNEQKSQISINSCYQIIVISLLPTQVHENARWVGWSNNRAIPVIKLSAGERESTWRRHWFSKSRYDNRPTLEWICRDVIWRWVNALHAFVRSRSDCWLTEMRGWSVEGMTAEKVCPWLKVEINANGIEIKRLILRAVDLLVPCHWWSALTRWLPPNRST